MKAGLVVLDISLCYWQLSLSSCAIATDILSQSVSPTSQLLHSSGIDVYRLLAISAEAGSNVLHAVASLNVNTRREFVKQIVSSLTAFMDRLLQVNGSVNNYHDNTKVKVTSNYFIVRPKVDQRPT